MVTEIRLCDILKEKDPQGMLIGQISDAIRAGGGPELKALGDKVDHIGNSKHAGIGSPSSIIPMLVRIVTKGVKQQTKPGYKLKGYTTDEGEPYGKGHFRWDWKARTLNQKELEHVKKVLVQMGVNSQEESDYNKEAKRFLQECEIKYETRFYTHDRYFPDDKEERDIYTITLTGKRGKWEFRFGQSIANTGSAPTEYDVLSCITKYDPGRFSEFCSEYGYDEDSRSAEKVYKAVQEEWENVQRIFTEEQIEMLQEIQ